MTLAGPQRRRGPSASTDQGAAPLDPAQEEAHEPHRTPANPEAFLAAQVLRDLRLGRTLRQALRAAGPAARAFTLPPALELEAVVVRLARQVGFRALQQSYFAVTQRQLTVDFRLELSSVSTPRAGLAPDIATLSHLTALMLGRGSARRQVRQGQLVDGQGRVDLERTAMFRSSTRRLSRTRRPGRGSPRRPDEEDGEDVAFIDDPAVLDALIGALEEATRRGELEGFLKAFQQEDGRSFTAFLGETVLEPGVRRRVLELLPAPVSAAQWLVDAFAEAAALGTVGPGSGRAAPGPDAPQRTLEGRWGVSVQVYTPAAGSSGHGDAVVAILAPDVPSDLGAGAGWLARLYACNAGTLARALGLLPAGCPVVLTGHGVGGALVQLAAAQHAARVRRVLTFQGVNIDRADVDRVRTHNRGTATPLHATHYRLEGDRTAGLGEEALPGVIHYLDRPAGAKDAPLLGGGPDGGDVTYAGRYDVTRDARQDPRRRTPAPPRATAAVQAWFNGRLPAEAIRTHLRAVAAGLPSFAAFERLIASTLQPEGSGVAVPVDALDAALGECLGVPVPGRVTVRAGSADVGRAALRLAWADRA